MPPADALAAAVRERRVLALWYDRDPPERPRIVHPQVLFRTPGFELHLEAVQVDGPSSSPLPGWRTFELVRIRRIETRPGRARRDPRLNLADPRYVEILATCPDPRS